MIIPAKNLPHYFHSLCFPVPVLQEKSREVALMATREDLLDLIAHGYVVGFGTYNRIKRLEMNEPLDVPPVIMTREKFDRVPTAADNCTTVKEQVSGGVLFQHHPLRSAAYLQLAHCREHHNETPRNQRVISRYPHQDQRTCA